MAVNETLGNLTGNVTGVVGDSGSWMSWITFVLKWIWNAIWGIVGVIFDIMNTNPVVGLIIVIMFLILLFWLLTLSQVAAAQGMKMFLYIGVIIVVFFIIWFLQNQFHLTDMFSGGVQNIMGIEGNATNGTVEVINNVSGGEGNTFWK